MTQFSHFDEEGRSRMVDVSGKKETRREAVARGMISMQAETFRMIQDRTIAKGDVLGVAQVAAIMAAKKTAEIVPMCHPLSISGIDIAFHPDPEKSRIEIEARVRMTGQTGVEMEALTAVSVAALTIYDMAKAVDRGMVISDIRLMKKSGGKSGTFVRNE